MSRQLIITLTLTAALILGLFGHRYLESRSEIADQATVGITMGRDLPSSAIVTPLHGGDPRPLSDEIVGATVVNFFASWCAPCRAENATLLQLRAEGVRVVGVAVRDEAYATQAFLDELGDPFFRVMADPQSEAMLNLGLGSDLPQTLVVSSDGRVILHHSGALVGTDGEAALREIREMAGPR